MGFAQGFLGQGHKALLLLVVLFNAAGEDVVVPAVHSEAVFSDGAGYWRLSAEVLELRDHVAADERGQLGAVAVGGVEGLPVLEGGFNVIEPASRLGEIDELCAVEGGLHGAAVGVSADDGVAHVEDFNGVLDGGGNAVDVVAGDGDDVADAAGDEEIAGIGAEDEVGHDAGVGAGDEEPCGSLAFSKEMEVTFPGGEDIGEKPFVSFDELLHGVSGAPFDECWGGATAR